MDGQVLVIFLISVILNFANSSLILTPFIKENRIEDAKNASRVDPKLFLGVESHSGFLTVDEKYDSNTFFWYFPIPNKPVNETPWIIWLQGGPGATSLFGLFEEVGPFYFSDTLKKRQWSWANEYSLLFIDNPIGSGYSFTKMTEGYATNMDTYGNHLLLAVQQFLKIFPELKQAPLFIAGESYAGRYVPALADQIHTHLSPTEINLKGLILGNPVFERESILNLSSTFYNWGLIDSQGLAAAKPLQEAYKEAVHSDDNEKARQKWNDLLDFLQDLSQQPQIYNMLKDKLDFKKFLKFLTPQIEEAIHVRTNGISKSHDLYLTNQIVWQKLQPDFLVHVRLVVEKLLDHYKMLVYCGQLDLTAPCILNADARRATWHWTKKNKFMDAKRITWMINGSIVGYVKSGGGFTEALVRGAGHLAPIDKPEVIYNLIKNFIDANPYTNDDVMKNKNFIDVNPYTNDDVMKNKNFIDVNPYTNDDVMKNKNFIDANPYTNDDVMKNKNFIDVNPYTNDDVMNNKNFKLSIVQLSDPVSTDKNTIALIISLVANVILVTGVCFWFVRRKLKDREELDDNWLYQPVDDTVHNNILQIA